MSENLFRTIRSPLSVTLENYQVPATAYFEQLGLKWKHPGNNDGEV